MSISPAVSPRIPVALALAVFVTIFALTAGTLWTTRDRHLGVHEDHFDKGVALYEHGSMSSGTKPMIFRPPGYPVFVAATLQIRDVLLAAAIPLTGSAELRVGRREAVLVAHAALLGLLGTLVFWFLFRPAGRTVALACAVAVGCNPALVVLAGFVSYELLHLVLVATATLLFVKSTEREEKPRVLFGQGLIWGAVTLVKSVTLIMPAFVLAWALLHEHFKKAVLATAFFTLGLCVVVAPYTLRNYAITGRFIPVNEQAAFALWGTSLERIPPGERYLAWVPMWIRHGTQTYTEVTGTSAHSVATFEDHILELSDRFSAKAADNLRHDPAIYAYNVSHNAFNFLTDQPTSYYFDLYQWPRAPRLSRAVAGSSLALISMIGLAGMIVGLGHRDRRWTLVALLFVMMWAAHALTFLEARYLYVKLPTIIGAFVLACLTMAASGRTFWQRAAAVLSCTAAVLAVSGLLML